MGPPGSSNHPAIDAIAFSFAAGSGCSAPPSAVIPPGSASTRPRSSSDLRSATCARNDSTSATASPAGVLAAASSFPKERILVNCQTIATAATAMMATSAFSLLFMV